MLRLRVESGLPMVSSARIVHHCFHPMTGANPSPNVTTSSSSGTAAVARARFEHYEGFNMENATPETGTAVTKVVDRIPREGMDARNAVDHLGNRGAGFRCGVYQ